MSDRSKRLTWVDNAKAIGITLVFYGHLVEALVDVGYQSAFPQFKFIYAFHMPLFFLISGFFFKRRFSSFGDEVKTLAYKRLIPVLTFGFMALLIWPIDLYINFGYIEWDDIAYRAYHYFSGHPDLNTITWFLVCLFTTEVIAVFILSKVKRIWVGLILSAIFFRFGLLITFNMKEAVISLGMEKNTWYIHEALVAFGFYILGYYSFELFTRLVQFKPVSRILLTLTVLLLTLLTFNLNQDYDGFVVIMKTSQHGISTWFLLTALLGSLAIILFASLVPQRKILDYIGANTLILLGVSGLFHEFFNPYIVRWFEIQDVPIRVTLFSLLTSFASLAVCTPLIWLLNKYIPQLVGKPYLEGPWLPDLKRFERHAWAKLLPSKKH